MQTTSDNNHFSSTKFFVSLPAIMKLVTIILFLSSSIIFLVSPICWNTPTWYPTLYPVMAATSGVLIAIMYTIFATGIVQESYRIWCIIDLVFNIIDFIIMLVISIITTTACDRATKPIQLIPGPMGISGAFLLAFSSLIWFFQNRSVIEVKSNEDNTENDPPYFYRKSVLV